MRNRVSASGWQHRLAHSMRITTWNVNGLRAAIRKGWEKHLERLAPDILLLQEIRTLQEQLPAGWKPPAGLEYTRWHPAEKKGYAGTAIFSRYPIRRCRRGMGGGDRDPEGRVLQASIEGIQVASIYMPSGSSSELRQDVKNEWLKMVEPWTGKRFTSSLPVILGGDFNIARDRRDIYHWRSNQQASGFLPHEREWIGRLLDQGWHDHVREQYGDRDGPYSWWSHRGRARELDRGWRIDYLLGNRAADTRVRSASIDRPAGLAVSDHAPVSIDLE